MLTRRVAQAMIAGTFAVFAAGLTSAAPSMTPLVDAAFLRANLGKPGLVVLEARGLPKAAYLVGHIPGAVFTDYGKDGWREKSAAGVDGMLPPPEKVAKLIGSLGIDNDSHVIIVPD
ncbi:MAG TPA: rhodanese-like domain-containing protein, partial [Hyphomicrobiaceae bacterium]|nr:rhodanese-like domain-containing protein [Hyphomicrobiaceae bacterium]